MAFSDKKMANQAAKAANERARLHNIKAYPCRFCKLWHIGKSVNYKRTLEERVECPNGCGLQIRYSRLEAHTAKCDGEVKPDSYYRSQREAQADSRAETFDPYLYDPEQDLD